MRGEVGGPLLPTTIFAGYLRMKKSFLALFFALLSACTPVPKRPQPVESEDSDRYITTRKNTYMVDMCDPSNMPRFPRRPKLSSKDLAPLTEQEMDKRIEKYLLQIDKHIDVLEETIVQTRRRVDMCR